MMTLQKFKEAMKKLVDRPNSLYSNEFPYNCCYYDGTFIKADCNNVIKAICWSNGECADNYTTGQYYYSPNSVMGDWTGSQILDHCTDISSDFSNVQDGEFLYMWNGGDWHCGVYYGDGKVFESTPIWEDGIQWSQLDKKGNRLYNGKSYGKWEKHGKLWWVEYPQVVTAEPTEPPTQTVTQTPQGQNIIIQNMQPAKESTEVIEKPTLMDSLVNLLKIKSLVTLALTVVVAIQAWQGEMNIEQIYLMVIAFYFGTQTTKGDNK